MNLDPGLLMNMLQFSEIWAVPDNWFSILLDCYFCSIYFCDYDSFWIEISWKLVATICFYQYLLSNRKFIVCVPCCICINLLLCIWLADLCLATRSFRDVVVLLKVAYPFPLKWSMISAGETPVVVFWVVLWNNEEFLNFCPPILVSNLCNLKNFQ